MRSEVDCVGIEIEYLDMIFCV